jgi:hypothetical protein
MPSFQIKQLLRHSWVGTKDARRETGEEGSSGTPNGRFCTLLVRDAPAPNGLIGGRCHSHEQNIGGMTPDTHCCGVGQMVGMETQVMVGRWQQQCNLPSLLLVGIIAALGLDGIHERWVIERVVGTCERTCFFFLRLKWEL